MDSVISTSPNQAARASTDLIKDASTATFQSDVLEASLSVPVLVDFWAPWCGPCKQLGPALEKIVTEAAGKIKLVKINVDENQELAGQLRVQSIPAVFAFSGGQPIDAFTGALPTSQLQAFVDKVIINAVPASGAPGQNPQEGQGMQDMNAQIEAALEAADSALQANDLPRAGEIYSVVLQQMPEHTPALLGMAKTMLKSGTIEHAKQILEQIIPDDQLSAEYLSLVKSIELAEQAATLGDVTEIQARIEANPDDHQSHLDLAIVLNAKDMKQEAAEILVQSFKRDREWNEGASRAKLLEFFEVWGPTDPASIKGRRALSSVLFS